MATKQDLDASTLALEQDVKELDFKIETVRAELKREIKELDVNLGRDIKSMGNAVIVKLIPTQASLHCFAV